MMILFIIYGEVFKMKINKLDLKCLGEIKKGNFSDLSVFDYRGVYILYDSDDEIVYVGSAYVRPIKERLKQYLSEKDTGNSLGNSIARELCKEKKDAVEIIKKLNIIAIKNLSLEYILMEKINPKYNVNGKKSMGYKEGDERSATCKLVEDYANMRAAEEAQKEAKETARRAFAMGLPIESVEQLVKLSREELERIAAEADIA